MAIRNLSPYLNFNGDAEQAIKLYERALGAKVENIMRFAEMPGEDVPPEHKGRILHSTLRFGEQTLMLSDSMPTQPVSMGTNVHVCLDFDDLGEMAQKFEALASGGRVTMPLSDTFWGARFGMLTDAFGVCWMFNCELKKG